MDDNQLIQRRNQIIINLTWITIIIDTLFNLVLEDEIQFMNPLIICLINSILTILNRHLNKPVLIMYIIVITSIGYTFYTTYTLPYISNFIFILIGIIIAAFYQIRNVLIFSAILSTFLQILLWKMKGQEILLNTSVYNFFHIFLFSAFCFFILLYMVNHSKFLKIKADKKESKAKEDLHSTKSLYESIFSFSKDAIAILDAKGHIIEFNQAFIDLYEVPDFGYKGEDLLPFFIENKKEFSEALLAAQNGNSITGLELNSIKLNGDCLIVEATFSPIFNVYSQMNVISCIIRDVTEKRLLEDYMRNSEKLKVTGEIAAGVAHEIRNPLTVISGFIQMLNEENNPNKQYFDIITSEIKRMNSIISEFLVLSKPHVSNIKLHNLQSLLTEVIVLFQSEAHYKGVTITKVFNSSPYFVYCEGNQLKQVFINLLKNAFEAMPDGGKVTITCQEKHDNQVQLIIKDTGVGIPEETLNNIGKPFFTTKEEGTGLGIMITERIIEQHHGSFHISSEIGKGTSVDILLPFVKENSPDSYLKSRLFE